MSVCGVLQLTASRGHVWCMDVNITVSQQKHSFGWFTNAQSILRQRDCVLELHPDQLVLTSDSSFTHPLLAFCSLCYHFTGLCYLHISKYI